MQVLFRKKDAEMFVIWAAQVETLLKTQDPTEQPSDTPAPVRVNFGQGTTAGRTVFPNSGNDLDFTMDDRDAIPDVVTPSDPFNVTASQSNLGRLDPQDALEFGADDVFSWELIGQGLEEPLPSQEVIDELFVGCM